MSENVQLGRIIGKREEVERDAIHVACCPVVLGNDYMEAGQRVKFAYGSTSVVIPADYGEWVGVIDPWLTGLTDDDSWHPNKGDRVWMLLKPGTATGLRHHYFHPVLDLPPVPASESERWLREFAQNWNFDYDDMVATATNPDKAGNYGPSSYICARGVDLHSERELGHDLSEFWRHMEVIAGKKFNGKHREQVGWTCSC